MAMELVTQLPYNHPYRWDGTLFGGPKLWQPNNIGSILALWLDAADTSTITLNGSTVSQWNDKSGNGRNAVQATAANQPTFNATGLNSFPTLDFDGTNDFMNIGLASTVINSAGSVFGVIRITTHQTNYNAVISWAQGFGNVGPGVGPFASSGTFGLYGTFGAGASNVFDVGPTTTNTNYLFSLLWSNNGLDVNGGLNGANTVGTRINSFDATIDGYLGRDSAAYSSARIGELIVSPTNLSTEERQQVEGYLAWKWGLQADLPVGHPYYNLPPTV